MGAKSSTPPPFILDRPKGAAIAEEIESIANNPELSRGQKNANMKNVVSSAFGEVRIKREFPDGLHLDLTRDDVRKVMTNMLKANQKNWGGYKRELKIVNAISAPSSPFLLDKVGSRKKIRDGRLVEFDLVAAEKSSRLKMAIEVKDWKIRSKADLEKAKEQISKIGKRASEEGVRAIWVNRDKVPSQYRDELAKFTRLQGVGFYDDATTGYKQIPKGNAKLHFDDILAREAKLLRGAYWTKIGGQALGGFAVLGEARELGYTAWQWQQGRLSTRQAVITAGGAIGGAAGGSAGLGLGAKGGAVVGSMFPGIGTAVGTGVGAAVGGIGGALFGGWVGEKGANYSVERLIYAPLEEAEKTEVIQSLKLRYELAP